MKRWLQILAGLILLGVIGLAVVVATFDVDRYRPMLVKELEQALGRTVVIERLSLGWARGLALRVQHPVIPDAPGAEPLLEMASANAVVRLGPLLRRRIDVTSIVLDRPRIHASRDAQGHVNAVGLAVAASPAAGARQPSAGGSAPVAFHVGSLRVLDGALHWTDAASSPPADVRLTAVEATVRNIAPGAPMDLDLQGALGAEARNLRVTGRLTVPGPAIAGALDGLTLSLNAVPIERLFAPAAAGEPSLKGRLTMSLQGRITTLDPPQIARALSGEGALQLEEGVVVNVNILRRVFEQLSVLPGLVRKLESRLPPEYQAKLAAKDTTLLPVRLTVRAEQERLRCDEVRVGTDSFRLTGSGWIGLEGAVDLRATLWIEPTLSAALVRSVEELSALVSATGEMEVPVFIQGRAPRVGVMPDVPTIASRLFRNKAQDLLGDLLKKALRPETPATPAP